MAIGGWSLSGQGKGPSFKRQASSLTGDKLDDIEFIGGIMKTSEALQIVEPRSLQNAWMVIWLPAKDKTGKIAAGRGSNAIVMH